MQPAPMTEDAETLLVSWSTRVRLLTNGEVWHSIALAFGATAVIMGVIVSAIMWSPFGLVIAAGTFVGLMVLFVIAAILVDLFGGFEYTFALTSHGVHCQAGKGQKTISNVAFWTGVLAGKPGVAGAGLLAESEQHSSLAYDEIRRVTIKPGRRYIHLKGATLDKPIGLFCTDESFPEAVRVLREKCPRATFVEQ